MDQEQQDIKSVKNVMITSIKYLIFGLTIGLVCYVIAAKKLTTNEILMIAVSAVFTYALIDTLDQNIGFSKMATPWLIV